MIITRRFIVTERCGQIANSCSQAKHLLVVPEEKERETPRCALLREDRL
jgi:hypothetical protein